MKKFIVISAGSDSEGPWVHQTFRGSFETPGAALEEFQKDWGSSKMEFKLFKLETGTFQILGEEEGQVYGFIVPVEV